MRNNRSLLGPKSVVYFRGMTLLSVFIGVSLCKYVCKLNAFWDEFLRVSITLADCEKEGYH